MKIGYARVSSAGQHLDTQIEKLNAFGCEKLYLEKQSGKSSDNRPVLKEALDFAREGDIFIVSRLDRLARSLLDLVKIVELLEKKRVGFVVLDQQIDTTTPTGRLIVHILSAIGEFERALINEWVREGVSNAKEKGVKFGRKAKLSSKQLATFCCEFDNPPKGMTKTEVAKKYGLARSSGYRLLNREKIKSL